MLKWSLSLSIVTHRPYLYDLETKQYLTAGSTVITYIYYLLIIKLLCVGCDVCNEKHDGECPMHGPLHSLRKMVTTGNSNSHLDNGTLLKFPDEVCLCTSSIPFVQYGVCARKRILAGTWIGPYEGKLVRPEDVSKNTDTQYMWEVCLLKFMIK